MNKNEKIDNLTLIHIDNFLLRTSMTVQNHDINYISCKNIIGIINQFKSNFSNFYFVTTNINFIDKINKELDYLNIKNKCIYVDCVCELATRFNQKIIIIGNDSFYNYGERLNKRESLIINTYNYDICYKSDDIIYDGMNNLHSVYKTKKKNFCYFIENENLYEKILMLKEDN